MKGVVLAGGTGSRLLPLTKVTNKHLLPVGREPMIFHPINKLVRAGIRDICIVTGTEHMGAVIGLLGSGTGFGADFTYRVQDGAGGIAQALSLARGFVDHDSMCVILGDNIFEDELGEVADRHRRRAIVEGSSATVLLSSVAHPERFGVAKLDGDIVAIEEKPERPQSNYAITGIYFYDSSVFDIIATLRPSTRGELEISDVNRVYMQRKRLHHEIMRGWWTDAGTHESLAEANRLVRG